jgi:DEAD/DEAH box helicase domain-containing protein
VNVPQIVDWLQSGEAGRNVTAVSRLEPRPARYAEWPSALDGRIVEALRARGIERPYTHQAEAIGRILDGQNVVTVTPTASGKTLCYNLPVLQAILSDREARAIYLFPTKALAQDQLAELHGLVDALGAKIAAHTYDGDTPANARRAVRQAGQVVITNPDMLHTGILPNHTQWHRLFANLRYVVIDEMHVYRGVFGSHVANVVRRLKRICRHYGASPRFILSSASIANPAELASRLVEDEVVAVTESGAPVGEKHLVFYNPPVVNQALGIRLGSLTTARKLAGQLLGNRVHTIVFGRSRLVVELLLRYLREDAGRARLPPEAIQGYRGGYLPNERRAIERGLRDGAILGVVSTNALELGIDIGSLEACVLVGYPGSIASTWQQIGRAGRRDAPSLAVLVASSTPLDQYLIGHPDYLLGAPAESGLINPDNLLILASHVKCAAFELPFQDGEEFGRQPLAPLLDHLAAERILHRSGDRYYWMNEAFPAQEVSLRTAASENVVIVDQTVESTPRVIGEMDRPSAATMLHDEAIYLHGGRQYEVIQLDWEEKKAFVRQAAVDYYTDANLAVRLGILEQFAADGPRAHGEVSVTYLATIYKKIKLDSHENVGWGKIRLPEDTFHTSAYWITFPVHPGRWTPAEIERGLDGIAHVLANVAPLFLMCDPRDLGVNVETRGPLTAEPTVYLYDAVPGGVGFAEKLYASHAQLVEAAESLVAACRCDDGCPSCVGAPLDEGGKRMARELLQGVRGAPPTTYPLPHEGGGV